MSRLAIKNEPESISPASERERWIESLNLPEWEEKLFRLEVSLKALDRFFNLENLPITQVESVITRDFSTEMRVVAGGCREVALAARAFLKHEANALTFASYIENKMLGDRARDQFLLRHVAQNTPAESLFLLAEAFQNCADIAQALTRLNTIAYPIFTAMGQTIGRIMATNRFFNPIEGEPFNKGRDRIKVPTVAQVVRDIADKDLRKQVSIALLELFRLLRYVQMIDWESDRRDDLRSNALLFALIHSEMRAFAHYLEKEAPKALQRTRGRKQTGVFLDAVDSLAFQCKMEIKKVFQHTLRDMLMVPNLSKLRGMVSAAAGILRNFLEQSVILIVQTFEPAVNGRAVFPDFVSKIEQSVRLREDLWVLSKLCDAAEQRLARTVVESADVAWAVGLLSDFIAYFSNLGFKFVRYSDHDEFESFFAFVQSTSPEVASNTHRVADLKRRIHTFNRFVETTLGLIRQRGELRDIPLDSDHARHLLDQFLQ